MERDVCSVCGNIHYVNPKIVVGSVCSWDGRILLCRRAIEPRRGFWTIPAGYLEEHETPIEGARREAREEACAEIDIDALLAVYSVSRISQVQLIYRATLATPEFSPGIESLETELVAWRQSRGTTWPSPASTGRSIIIAPLQVGLSSPRSPIPRKA